LSTSERIRNEVSQLLRLKKILDADKKLPVRIDIERRGLTFSSFLLRLRGVEGLIAVPRAGTGWKTSAFNLDVTLPPGYPNSADPQFTFHPPIPFHPHIWPHGSFCWGDVMDSKVDMSLVDWVVKTIEFINWTESIVARDDPGANREAKQWWEAHKGQATRHYLIPVDLARLRFFVNNVKVT
jgi:ubiquitin-protein ligase